MAAGLDLSFVACRMTFRALQPIHFPDPASNRLRGALGTLLPEGIFRPSGSSGPSGFRDRPRPFVLRSAHLDNRRFVTGDSFTVGFNSFVDPSGLLEAFGRLGWAELTEVERSAKLLKLGDCQEQIRKVRVHFETPTELKPWTPSEGALPPFEVLAARLRDRLSSLRAFYGPGPLEIDFRATADAAARIKIAGGAIHHHPAVRRSSHTGQTHPLGGFVGHVDYEGELGPFSSWLEAGYWTGVGRQTVWGNGAIRVEVAVF